jgi:peroxiredoxin
MMRIYILATALAALALMRYSAAAQDKPQRTPEQVQADLKTVRNELRGTLGGKDLTEIILDSAQRQDAASTITPLLRRMNNLLGELMAVVPDSTEQLLPVRYEYLMLLSALGDADAKTELAKLGKAEGSPGVEAQMWQLLAQWVVASKDELAQGKALDAAEKLAKAHPKEDSIATALMKMSTTGAASPAMSTRAEDIVLNNLTGEEAKLAKSRVQGARKQRDSLGKVVELTGTTVDGEKFSTRDWKGKVILVDYWATWCAPCVEALPRVRRMYLDYHGKGLEIVGVTSDSELTAVKAFFEKNKGMPWPQLFDQREQGSEEELHRLCREWGVWRLPTMFLIDRKGVLRNVSAEEKFEELIPKLLEEKAE